MAGPDGCRIFSSRNKSSLKEIGSTELFHESAEPEFEELSREDFLTLHPPGQYTFHGKTIEGDNLMGTAVLSHAQPLGPVIVFEDGDGAGAGIGNGDDDDDDDDDLPVVDPANFVVE